MVEMRLQFLPFYFYIIILKLLYYNLYKYLYAFLKFYFITNTFCYQYQVSDHILQPCLLFPFICFSPLSVSPSHIIRPFFPPVLSFSVPRVSFSSQTHGFDKWKTREEEKHRNSLLPVSFTTAP